MRRLKKKWLAVMLILSLLAAITAVLPAENTDAKSHIYEGELSLIQEGAFAAAENHSARNAFSRHSQSLRSKAGTDIINQVRDVVYRGLLLMEEEIDVSAYQIECEVFGEIIQDLTNSSADLFHVSSHYTLWTDNDSVYVRSYIPRYEFDEAETSRMREEFNAAVTQILSGVNPEWSDREKALYVHDTLISQYEYDESLQKFDAYSLLVGGSAVCQGYTLAYNYLMDRMGIPCASVASNEMKHIWNQIEIDGDWYHVDMTYDDPLPDLPGAALHDNFLLSDTGIGKTDHKNWNAIYVCSDIRYDAEDYFWKSSMAPFQNDGTNWYFIKNITDTTEDAGICRWNPINDNIESICDLSQEIWYSAIFNQAYQSKYSGLGIRDGVIYYNTPKEIQYFSPEAPEKIYVLEIPEMTEVIYGMRIKENELEYAFGMQVDEILGIRTAKGFEPASSSYDWPSPTPIPTHTPVPTSPAVSSPSQEPVQKSTQVPPVNSVSPTSPVPSAITSVQSPVQTAAAVRTEEPGINQQATSHTNTKISITARKGAKKLTVRVSPGTKTVISLNKKIIIGKKKKCRKITIPVSRNKNGIIKISLSSRLKKKMKITVTVYAPGKKITKKVTVK